MNTSTRVATEFETGAGPVSDSGGLTSAKPDAGATFVCAFFRPENIPEMISDWRDLYRDSDAPNPFFSPWSLPAAIEHFGEGNVELLCVWRWVDGARTLVALAPVRRERVLGVSPISKLVIWLHKHCYYASPLLRKGCEAQAISALVDALATGELGGDILTLDLIDPECAAIRLIKAAALSRGAMTHEAGSFERACLEGGVAADEYLEKAIRKKKRKELRRLRNRLQDLGEVTFEVAATADQVDGWGDAFLAMEHAGWKGREGTSLASQIADAEFFKETLAGAFDDGVLMFCRLALGGQPIAMIVNFVSVRDGFSFKICHDEAYAKFSPGVMIELELTRYLLEKTEICFMDSCAQKDHPMIDGLWVSRRTLTNFQLFAPGMKGRAVHAAYALRDRLIGKREQ